MTREEGEGEKTDRRWPKEIVRHTSKMRNNASLVRIFRAYNDIRTASVF